jgi:hypothetical protein
MAGRWIAEPSELRGRRGALTFDRPDQRPTHELGGVDALPLSRRAHDPAEASRDLRGDAIGISAATVVKRVSIEHGTSDLEAMPLFDSPRHIVSFFFFLIDVLFSNFLRLKAESLKIVGYERALPVAGEVGLQRLAVVVQVHRESDARNHPAATDRAPEVMERRPRANGDLGAPAMRAACATVTASSRSKDMRT